MYRTQGLCLFSLFYSKAVRLRRRQDIRRSNHFCIEGMISRYLIHSRRFERGRRGDVQATTVKETGLCFAHAHGTLMAFGSQGATVRVLSCSSRTGIRPRFLVNRVLASSS